jgi:hypothetical protein
MTGFIVGGNLPVFCGRNRTQMGTTRDRNRHFPANLTMPAGNWIVKKIQHLRHGKPALLRTADGSLLLKRKHDGDRSTWSRLVPKPAPPPPAKPRQATLSARDAALARARTAWQALVHRRLDPKEHTVSTHRAAFAMGMAGLAALKNNRDDDLELALIKELILLELPGLDGKYAPTKEQIREEIDRYEERHRELEEEKAHLLDSFARPIFLNETMQELARCEECLSVLADAFNNHDQIAKDPNYWLQELENRWNGRQQGDLFQILRRERDLEKISADHAFYFLPQEKCILERIIATYELHDLYHSRVLTDDEFPQLIERLARGWPGVREDSKSCRPEDRANAAGCFRSLAQLSNRGKLPRNVLAEFQHLDDINRKLLKRAAEREQICKFVDGETDLDLGAAAAKGRELGAKYAELMQAERNLAAAGMDIKGVRVDELLVRALINKDPALRKRVSLLLARIADIEDDIQKLDPTFVRKPPMDATTLKVMEQIDDLVGADVLGLEPEPLLHYGITRADMRDMGLPTVLGSADIPQLTMHDSAAIKRLEPHIRDLRNRDIATIRNLARMGFSNAGEVKAQNEVIKAIRDGVVNTTAGRIALASGVGLTTAQLASEFVSSVFRSVTGKHDRLDLRHDDPDVVGKMRSHARYMRLSKGRRREIGDATRRIAKRRALIIELATKKDPSKSDIDRLAGLAQANLVDTDFIRKQVLDDLGNEQSNLVTALIRAAVLSARPTTVARLPDVESHFEHIDAYDASRYAPQIDDILTSWGLDIELYRALIDEVVLGRAEASRHAPGTVTADTLARWHAEFTPSEEFQSYLRQQRKDARGKIPAGRKVADYFSGKDTTPISPELVERVVTAIDALANFDKPSIRTHTLAKATVPIDAGMGAAIILSGVGGSQHSFIIRRIFNRIEVRLVSGDVDEVTIGETIELNGVVAALDIGATTKFAKWMTKGGSLHFPIERDADGRENVSKAQEFVRALLAGDLPTAEFYAARASKWQETEKSGSHVKIEPGIGGAVGFTPPTPGVKLRAGISGNASLQYWHRKRHGVQRNAEATKIVEKRTTGIVASAGGGVGVSLTGKTEPAAASVSEHPGASAPQQNLGGASAGFFGYDELQNRSVYELTDNNGITQYREVDVFRLIGHPTTAKEAFSRFPPQYGLPFSALLEEEENGVTYDRTTILENGETVSFRKAVEQMLGRMRENDGLLLWFTLHKDALDVIQRGQMRIRQIRHEMLPLLRDSEYWDESTIGGKLAKMLQRPAAAVGDPLLPPGRNAESHQELKRKRRTLEAEIKRLEARIEHFKSPSYLVPYGVFVVPLQYQQDGHTVFNGLGLIEISHVGVRVPDNLPFSIPTERLDGRHRENAEGWLDQAVNRYANEMADKGMLPPRQPDQSNNDVQIASSSTGAERHDEFEVSDSSSTEQALIDRRLLRNRSKGKEHERSFRKIVRPRLERQTRKRDGKPPIIVD